MSNKIISTEEEVNLFLKTLKDVLSNSCFNISTDLDILQRKKHESSTDSYTTINTLVALNYDKHDVYNELLSLKTGDYMESFIDDKDCTLPPFFAFTKSISSKDV